MSKFLPLDPTKVFSVNTTATLFPFTFAPGPKRTCVRIMSEPGAGLIFLKVGDINTIVDGTCFPLIPARPEVIFIDNRVFTHIGMMGDPKGGTTTPPVAPPWRVWVTSGEEYE